MYNQNTYGKRSFSIAASTKDSLDVSREPGGIPAEIFEPPRKRRKMSRKEESKYAISPTSEDEDETDQWEVKAAMSSTVPWFENIKPKAQRLPLGAVLSAWKVAEYEILSASSSLNACFVCALFHIVKKEKLGIGGVRGFLQKCATYLKAFHPEPTKDLVEKIEIFCDLETPQSLHHDLWSPHYLKRASAAVMKTDVYVINGHNLQNGPVKLEDNVLVEKFCKEGTHSVLTQRKLATLRGDNRILFWPQMRSNHWYFMKLKFLEDQEGKVTSKPEEDEWGADIF